MKVLAIGAHPDDIELGCGGALLRHVQAGDSVTMLVMTPGERGPQGATSRIREQEAAARVIGAELLWGDFEDGAIPHGREAVAFLDAIVRRTGVDVMYTHAPRDTHQDHVATANASIAAGRRLPRVLCYQAPSTTSFDPTVFVDVEAALEGKLAALRAHWSQVAQCAMVDLEAVQAGCRFWGHRARMRFAEPFETPRFVWQIGASAAVDDVLESDFDKELTDPHQRVLEVARWP